jgi:D-alanyl-D-alanine carboxypeptidase/D-alanyl-D-alanine-endopeptidase (penicillin-binding protein 4)
VCELELKRVKQHLEWAKAKLIFKWKRELGKHSYLLLQGFLLSMVVSCSVQQKIGKQANTTMLTDTALAHAHIGISIFEPATNKFLYNYQGEKYFTPASNTKLFTLYAALKYLGDSIVAARYYEEDGTVILQATGRSYISASRF